MRSGVKVVSVRRLGFDEFVLAPAQAADLELACGTIQIDVFASLSGAVSDIVFAADTVSDRSENGARGDVSVFGHAILPREGLRLPEGPLGAGKRTLVAGVRRHLGPSHGTGLTSVRNLGIRDTGTPSGISASDGDRVHRIGHFITVRRGLLLQVVRTVCEIGNLELTSSRVLVLLGVRGLVNHV